MPDISEVLTSLIERHGGNKSKIARKLGVIGESKMTSQQIGHYASGKYKPKGDFYKKWKEVFGDDLERLVEGNVSRETGVVPAHVLEHYRNTAEHIMTENKNLWELVKDLRSSETRRS